MRPQLESLARRISRRQALAALGGLVACGGCSTPLMRGQSPEAEEIVVVEEKKTELVGDLAGAWGTNWVKLESVGLITNLNNTGSDPPPSQERSVLINEMQSHEVHHPNEVLASPTTSMVLVRGFLPPGSQKGDRIDVEIRVPPRSETTSLRGGWLMASRMRQVQMMGGSLHTGSVEGLAQGEMIVDALFEADPDKTHEVRGRVLGGGYAAKDRKLGLGIRREDKSVKVSVAIGNSVNARFHSFDNGVKKGVAKPQRDNFIELTVPTRYKNNLARYLKVVRSIAVRETPADRVARLELLEKKLLNPPSVVQSALQLEAIGKDAIPALKKGIASSDSEVKFYSAEAAAYLDVPEAAEPLREAAAQNHSFRWHALTALTVMDHISAFEALNDLLHEVSVEARYGAFRALTTRSPNDPLVKGEVLNKFHYHVLTTRSEPLIHIARSRRMEIVVFGADITVLPHSGFTVGRNLVVKSTPDGRFQVVRIIPGSDNVVESCGGELDSLIRTIAKQGGAYGEVIQFLQEAKKSGILTARIAYEALATPNRQFEREADESEMAPPDELQESGEGGEELASAPPVRKAATPEAELFRDPLSRQREEDRRPATDSIETFIDPEYKAKKKTVWDKMTGWWK